MIPKQDLGIVERHHRTGRGAADIQALNPAYPTILVSRRAMKSCGKFLSRPLLQLAVVDKFDPGIRSECLPDKIAVARSMRPEIELNSISRTILGQCRTCHREDCRSDHDGQKHVFTPI